MSRNHIDSKSPSQTTHRLQLKPIERPNSLQPSSSEPLKEYESEYMLGQKQYRLQKTRNRDRDRKYQWKVESERTSVGECDRVDDLRWYNHLYQREQPKIEIESEEYEPDLESDGYISSD
ncbi:MAG: hypothetical protein ABIN35_00005 [candidate division WOR-3 bacterium]